MKKANRLSLSLGFLGVSMIGAAIFLQYRSFQIEKENSVIYEKVTMKDLSSGTVEKVSQKENENNNIVEEKVENPLTDDNTPTEEVEVQDEVKEITTYEDVSTTPVDPIVYDGMTLNQLAEKLNRSLGTGYIAGKGYLIASQCIEKGVDPYVAVAIMLHETGCKYNCSTLVKTCNNVGGQKGSPGCNGGSYKAFATLDDGIIGFIDNLQRNYYSRGLNTIEKIAPKYAASSAWPTKIRNYVDQIRAS